MAYGNGLNQGLPDFFATTGVASDISRPYLFLLNIPAITDSASDYAAQGRLTAWCRTASLPGFSLKTNDIKFQGINIKVAGPSEFKSDWELEFLLDEQHTLRAAFLAWMQAIYDPNKMSHSAPKYYKANNVKIQQLDKRGSAVCTYTFAGMYPSNVSDVELSHEAGEPSKCKVTMTYDFFTVAYDPNGIDPAAGSGNPTFQ